MLFFRFAGAQLNYKPSSKGQLGFYRKFDRLIRAFRLPHGPWFFGVFEAPDPLQVTQFFCFGTKKARDTWLFSNIFIFTAYLGENDSI